ncbi:hypothetical protein D3C86_1672020 [compost metagenome]
MNDSHLARMDAQSAAKAHVASKFSGIVQACGVLDCGKDTVQRRGQPGYPSAEQHGIAGMTEEFFGGAAAGGQVQVQSQIEAAER